MSLEMELEDSLRSEGEEPKWCAEGQTVPNTSSGDRKSRVTDGGQFSMADNQWWRQSETKSLTSLNVHHLTELSTRYDSADLWKHFIHKDCTPERDPFWRLWRVELVGYMLSHRSSLLIQYTAKSEQLVTGELRTCQHQASRHNSTEW